MKDECVVEQSVGSARLSAHWNRCTTHLFSIIVMKQLDRLIAQERVVVAGSEEGGRNRAVWQEHKSVRWVEYLVTKFNKRRQLMVDLCVGTLPVVKKCMMVPKTRRCVWCKLGTVNFTASMSSVVETVFKPL